MRLTIILLATAALAQDVQPDFNVTHGPAEFQQADRMLASHLSRLNRAQTERREQLLRDLRSTADIQRYQSETRALLEQAVGQFPPRTPLNPTLTGTLDRGAYAIEKVIFEARPQHYITANVFVPRNRRPPFPAVITTIGHWGPGKAHEDHQRMAAYMARRGILVVTYDVPGQGERIEHYSPIFRRTILDRGSSEYFVTTEHNFVAAHAILAKGSFLHYLLWDGIRTIDYAASRPDVDPNRLAAAGTSGGGWLTEAIAAYDTRIKAAIPVCYGGCAADQLLNTELGALDMDALIAPRPLLLIGATGDSRDNVAGKIRKRDLIAPIYQIQNVPDRLRFMLAESRHGFTDSMYPVAFEFLTRHLNPPAGPEPTPLGPPESEADLNATLTGQVTSSLATETTFTLARATARQATRPRPTLAGVAAKLGIPLAAATAPKATILARFPKATHTVEKLVYYPEPDIYIPSILFLPASSNRAPGLVLINETGKTTGKLVDDYIRPLVESGYAVLTIDPRGMGETSPASSPNVDYRGFTMDGESTAFYAALHLKRTLVGMRVQDVRSAAAYLATRPDIDPNRLTVAGIGTGGVLALYAAAFEPGFKAATAINALASYASFAETDLYTVRQSLLVPSVLESFDLPDIAALAAPRRVTIVNPITAAHTPTDLAHTEAQYRKAGNNAKVLRAASPSAIVETLKR